MTFPTHPIPLVPDATAAATLAAFPGGNRSVTLREELGTLFTDAMFAPWFTPVGAPVRVAPWRLALVLVLQELETLTDRQAADNVRRCLDWKYLLSLEVTDPGFDFTLLHDFRERLLTHHAEQPLLDPLITAFKARGLLKAGGRQRTDATHILANVRALNRIEWVGETMRATLEVLATVAPDWLQPHIDPNWLERYAVRFDAFRLPNKPADRDAIARLIGQDGRALLTAVYASTAPPWLRMVPAVDVMRQVWLQQFVTVDGNLRFRADTELPPTTYQIVSPYDPDARWSKKRTTHWTGYKVHLTETCDDSGPHLITHVATTPATTQDVNLTAPIHADLAQRDLLPDEHLVDAAYVASEVMVTSHTTHQVDLVGPVPADTSWQARAQTGYDIACFQGDWEACRVTCPEGQISTVWRPGKTDRDQSIITVAFDPDACATCPARARCTKAAERPRSLKLRPQAQHETLQAGRQAYTTDGFNQRYAKRAGIEGTIAQGTGRFRLRRTPYRGQAKTHLHHILIAIAINLTRFLAWFLDDPRPGSYPRHARFATLAAGRTA